VFTKKEVGDFFNEKFISVRLQMDRTKHDNDQVRNWYITATDISNEYGIPSFPTYLFFSPTGKLISRDGGYRPASSFVNVGKKAMDPDGSGKYIVFYSFLAKYQQGKRDYNTMAALADTAKMLFLDSIAAVVSKDYRQFLLGKSESEWFIPKNLSFMANFIEGSKDPFFPVFYKTGSKVDSLLNQIGFSQFVVDNVIQKEEIEPVTKPLKGMRSSSYKPSAADKEPDWSHLQQQITTKYTTDYAERNLLYARTIWYADHLDWAPCAKYLTLFSKKYPITYYSDYPATLRVFLNSMCWQAIFKRSVDKEQIDAGITCMKPIVKKYPYPALLDTYANLLYKAGKAEEAVQVEEEAAAKEEGLKNVLERMKQKKPTWPHYVSSDPFDSGLPD
jgi:hypothetical protein